MQSWSVSSAELVCTGVSALALEMKCLWCWESCAQKALRKVWDAAGPGEAGRRLHRVLSPPLQDI